MVSREEIGYEMRTIPPPFEAHYNGVDVASDEDANASRGRVDVDLSVHFTTIVLHGVALGGEAVSDVFTLPRRSTLLRGVHEDIKWMLEDNRLRDDPVYVVLNLCRAALIANHKEPYVIGKLRAAEIVSSHTERATALIIESAVESFRETTFWAPSATELTIIGDLARQCRADLESALRQALHNEDSLACGEVQRPA